jgi:hypothetical protein
MKILLIGSLISDIKQYLNDYQVDTVCTMDDALLKMNAVPDYDLAITDIGLYNRKGGTFFSNACHLLLKQMSKKKLPIPVSIFTHADPGIPTRDLNYINFINYIDPLDSSIPAQIGNLLKSSTYKEYLKRLHKAESSITSIPTIFQQ